MELRLESCTVDLETGNVRCPSGEDDRLTAKERALLAYLAERPGTSVSHEELLQEVWEYAAGVQSRATYYTLRRLRTKIERDASAPVHILSLYGDGLRFVPRQQKSRAPFETGPTALMVPRPPPPMLNGFIGRTEEQNQVQGLLDAGHRLITLVGLGGVGKTRLANNVAHTGQRTPVYIEARGATSRALLQAAVADAMQQEVTSLDAATHQLVGLGPVLLVVDNAEDAPEIIADLVESWLRACPEVSALVTSRTPLRIPDEVVVPLGGLTVDQARELLVNRARAARPGVSLDDAWVTRLAADLGGMPLALELAARWLSVTSPEQLQQRLSVGFLDRRGTADHTRLADAIAWSWEALDPSERAALQLLSQFAGSFSLADVEALVVGESVDVIERLVSLGWVGTSEYRGELVFTMHSLLRDHVRGFDADGSARRAYVDHIGRFCQTHTVRFMSLHGPTAYLVLGRSADLQSVASDPEAGEDARGRAMYLALFLAYDCLGGQGLDELRAAVQRQIQSTQGPWGLLVRGHLARLDAEATQAEERIEASLDQARQEGCGEVARLAQWALAALCVDRGRLPELQDIRSSLRDDPETDGLLLRMVDAFEVMAQLQAGSIEKAAAWVHRRSLQLDGKPLDWEAGVLATWYQNQGDYAGVLRVHADRLEQLRTTPFVHRLMNAEVWIWAASVVLRRPDAMERLRDAVNRLRRHPTGRRGTLQVGLFYLALGHLVEGAPAPATALTTEVIDLGRQLDRRDVQGFGFALRAHTHLLAVPARLERAAADIDSAREAAGDAHPVIYTLRRLLCAIEGIPPPDDAEPPDPTSPEIGYHDILAVVVEALRSEDEQRQVQVASDLAAQLASSKQHDATAQAALRLGIRWLPPGGTG